MTLRELLQAASERFARRPALLFENGSWSHAELATRCLARVAHLRGLGLEEGQRVAAFLPNSPAYLELYIACALDGLVLVPLNLRLHARELSAILADCDAALLVHERGASAQLEAALEGLERRPALAFADHQDRGCARPLAFGDLNPIAPEDPAQIYYTSGTSGRPKGVVLSHANVCAHARAACEEFALSSTDVWGHFAPMFHLADAWAIFAISLAGGAHVFLERFEAGACLDSIARHAVSMTNLVPSMLQRIVAEPFGSLPRAASLRLLLSGGAPIAPELVLRIEEQFDCEYVQTYGLTETCPFLTASLLDEEIRQLQPARQTYYRSRTGRAFGGVELRVVDSEGRDVARDGKSVGEIRARGAWVFKGYWRQPAATREAFEAGWFLTGDLATIEGRGFLNIVDRKKDVILTGGETVYSTEVENALYTHQGVAEVAVFPQEDEQWGEVVAAAVVLKSGGRELKLAELIGHCRLFLAPYKLPRLVYFVDELPLGGSGKVQKRLLRERCLDLGAERITP